MPSANYLRSFIFLGVSSALLTGCPPPDTLTAFKVELVVSEDCTQTASSAVQCVDEAELKLVKRTGRWIIDDRPNGFFVITTETGQNHTGLTFADTGGTQTETCQGEGGNCYFARTRVDTIDDETDCTQIVEHSIDIRIDDDGVLEGFRNDVSVTEEECGTNTASVKVTDITGEQVEEVVLARDEFEASGS